MALSVVVTGASGFIGNHLVKYLKNYSNLKLYPVSKTKKNSNYFYLETFKELPKADIIFHLGQNSNRSLVNKNIDFVREALEDIEYIIAKKYKKIIFCSSSTVYGNKGYKPYTENDLIFEYDFYSSMKIKSEKRIIEEKGCVLRLSNVIGINMSRNTVLMNIIQQLGTNNKLLIKNIKPIRDFVAIEDVINAMVNLLNINITGFFNVGTGIGTSIKELAHLVLSISKENNREIVFEKKQFDRSYNVVNVSKLNSLVENNYQTSIEETIKSLIKNEKKNNIRFHR
ncbi:NAD-dependent epimerase/dehydratase family protein [Alphaproteobacteria bacterium]|nr:NAD-dependent epimerase/dehydratase family protein [Alphaproteobacteria bacterium]